MFTSLVLVQYQISNTPFLCLRILLHPIHYIFQRRIIQIIRSLNSEQISSHERKYWHQLILLHIKYFVKIENFSSAAVCILITENYIYGLSYPTAYKQLSTISILIISHFFKIIFPCKLLHTSTNILTGIMQLQGVIQER